MLPHPCVVDQASGRGWASATVPGVDRLHDYRPHGATSACWRCHRTSTALELPRRRSGWEPILEDGEVIGVVCPDCLTLREQRRIQAEKARVVRRLKRGMPP
jgi:hypothetical protein